MFWLKGKGDFISVVCYATVEGPNAIENNAKYKILQDLVRNSQSERIIVLGDINSRVGVLSSKILLFKGISSKKH